MGSVPAPGDKMKTRGVHALLSLKHASKSSWGGSRYLCPSVIAVNSAMPIVSLSGRSTRSSRSRWKASKRSLQGAGNGAEKGSSASRTSCCSESVERGCDVVTQACHLLHAVNSHTSQEFTLTNVSLYIPCCEHLLHAFGTHAQTLNPKQGERLRCIGAGCPPSKTHYPGRLLAPGPQNQQRMYSGEPARPTACLQAMEQDWQLSCWSSHHLCRRLAA